MIDKIRKARGMTQEDVASWVGISRSAYANIENGKRRPSPDVAKRIGSYLGFDWTQFYDDKPINDAEEAVQV